MFFDYGTATQKAFSPGASAVIVDALTPEQRERAFPGLSREAAVEALRRDREAASADPGIEDQQAADARAWDTHLSTHRPVSSRIGKIVSAFAMLNTCAIPMLLAVLLGGGWLFEWAGWSTDWGYTVINVFLGALAAWIPVCAVWSVAAQISFRAVSRECLNWASRRDGQRARGVTTVPVPDSEAYLLAGGTWATILPSPRPSFLRTPTHKNHERSPHELGTHRTERRSDRIRAERGSAQRHGGTGHAPRFLEAGSP